MLDALNFGQFDKLIAYRLRSLAAGFADACIEKAADKSAATGKNKIRLVSCVLCLASSVFSLSFPTHFTPRKFPKNRPNAQGGKSKNQIF